MLFFVGRQNTFTVRQFSFILIPMYGEILFHSLFGLGSLNSDWRVRTRDLIRNNDIVAY